MASEMVAWRGGILVGSYLHCSPIEEYSIGVFRNNRNGADKPSVSVMQFLEEGFDAHRTAQAAVLMEEDGVDLLIQVLTAAKGSKDEWDALRAGLRRIE